MTIDGKDIGATWNMCLVKDSFNSLLKYPKRMAARYTNYAERDGITPDLRRFETEPRQVSLVFFITHSSESEFRALYDDFFAAVNDSGYHMFDFGIGLSYKFRYDRTRSMRMMKPYSVNGGTVISMEYMEDAASINERVKIAIGGIELKGMYSVGGVDFGDFGIHPDGTVGEVLKYADAKEAFSDGRVYNLNTRRLRHKEITIPLWMYSVTQAEFINNYQAFYNAFAKSGSQSVYIREIDAVVESYYLECTTYKVNWGSRVTARFSIKLCIPVVGWLRGVSSSNYRVMSDPELGLLADEEGRILTLNR